MDLGKTKGKIKRQRRHSKWEDVEKVFWCGNSEEIKKRSVKMSKHKFSMKKKTGRKKKTQRNMSPFQNKSKSGNKRETLFYFFKVCKRSFCL